MSKYMEFKATDEGSDVFNKKSGLKLGNIFFYRPWLRYVFEPRLSFAVFSDDCLNDISQQIKHLERNKPKE